MGVLRDSDSRWYMREEAGGLILGPYEDGAPACYVDGPSKDSEYELFQEDLERLAPHIEGAIHRVPAFGEVGGILCVPFFENFVILTVNQWFVVLISTLVGCSSYLLLVLATRQGDVSVISPFRYTRLIFALILAILFLGERPDILALSGMAIIVLSGCYTLWREKVRGQSSSV